MSNLNSPVSKEDIAFLLVAANLVVTARGCSAVHTGPGVYTVTLDSGNGVNATQMDASLAMGSAGTVGRVGNTSDTVKVVSIDDTAGAPLDGDFSLSISRVA